MGAWARLGTLLLAQALSGSGGQQSSSYYTLLKLGKDASTKDVKRQFRKLSVKLHPDKNAAANTDEGRKVYQRLQTAHEWLSNDDRRQLYDLYGQWDSIDDRTRGDQFSQRHNSIEFFRDEPLIRNVRTEPEANEIFGLRSRRPYLMMLYTPWLTTCMEATDAYRKVAHGLMEETGKDGIRLAAVNCESNLQAFCLRYGRLRNQFELPVVLLLDPTDSSMDRYRGRMVAKELEEYAIASDKGIQHVHTLDERSFQAQILNSPPTDFWLVLFCDESNSLCQDVKPTFKRLAFSAREAAKVGLVNCRTKQAPDGYIDLEDAFCQEQGVQETPALLAFRRGTREQQGEVIPLLMSREDQQDIESAAPMAVLRAMEAMLRLSAPSSHAPAPEEGQHGDADGSDDDDADGQDVPRAKKQSRTRHQHAADESDL